MKNIALYYFGASGGFFALWHILLGTDYRCEFMDALSRQIIEEKYNILRGADWPVHINDATIDKIDAEFWDSVQDLQLEYKKNHNLEDIYKNHWHIVDKSRWKTSEIWPDNNQTQQATFDKKVFYYLNPEEKDWEEHSNDYRIMLYTDLDLQILLAKNKCAWYFLKGEPPQEKIRQIKNDSTWLDGTQVYGPLTKFTQANLYVKLQDLVITKGRSILEPLGYAVTQQNLEHTEMWLRLHDDEEQKLLTI